jgi:GntR family transcriptional repressor for pyruvate dehydrogenase complex
MAIEKIEKQNVVDIVFNTLRQEIVDRHFLAGDKLPATGELAREFGVSETTVKLALQRLATLGLIETRVGQGSFVLEFDAEQYLSQIDELVLGKSDISMIIEFRMYFEMGIIRLAIRKATEENYANMEHILSQMETTDIENNVVRHAKLDYQFHLEICKSTQNTIFVLIYEMIGKILFRHTTALNRAYFHKHVAGQIRDEIHTKLFHALKDKDITLCRHCMMEMLSVFNPLPEEDYKSC